MTHDSATPSCRLKMKKKKKSKFINKLLTTREEEEWIRQRR